MVEFEKKKRNCEVVEALFKRFYKYTEKFLWNQKSYGKFTKVSMKPSNKSQREGFSPYGAHTSRTAIAQRRRKWKNFR